MNAIARNSLAGRPDGWRRSKGVRKCAALPAIRHASDREGVQCPLASEFVILRPAKPFVIGSPGDSVAIVLRGKVQIRVTSAYQRSAYERDRAPPT